MCRQVLKGTKDESQSIQPLVGWLFDQYITHLSHRHPLFSRNRDALKHRVRQHTQVCHHEEARTEHLTKGNTKVGSQVESFLMWGVIFHCLRSCFPL
jgi:hypothetical protein